MAFKDLMDKAKDAASGVTDAAGKLVDEFNQALPTMRALGFTVKDLRVGSGLTPQIGATLVASTDTIDVAKIKTLMDQHAENKILVNALKALELAFHVKQQIGSIPFKGVELDVTLGLPPHVGVAFISTAPAAAPVAAV